MGKVAIAIHGGAGRILKERFDQELIDLYKTALSEALQIGYKLLKEEGSALDAVEYAVRSLEDCPLFNAGRGAVLNERGGHEMDAAIMDGSTLEAGAVALVSEIRYPIGLARKVMDFSEHILMAGEGAMNFAKAMNCEYQPNEWFRTMKRVEQWKKSKVQERAQLDHDSSSEHKFGTVGAVAIDYNGKLAAATSTGGMTNKKLGRIGDSALIGAGTFANHLCAVSCTGHGESFMKNMVAYDLSCLIEYMDLTLFEAGNFIINEKLIERKARGGLIAIDHLGNIEMPFNTEGMFRASIGKDEMIKVAIF